MKRNQSRRKSRGRRNTIGNILRGNDVMNLVNASEDMRLRNAGNVLSSMRDNANVLSAADNLLSLRRPPRHGVQNILNNPPVPGYIPRHSIDDILRTGARLNHDMEGILARESSLYRPDIIEPVFNPYDAPASLTSDINRSITPCRRTEKRKTKQRKC
jgi:hypothetical protein